MQEYSALFEGAGNNPGEKTLEDKFFEHEVSSLLMLTRLQDNTSFWMESFKVE
jgi:hypothetical protein